AFRLALAAYVSASSATPVSRPTSSTPAPASSSPSSWSLPSLPEASTSFVTRPLAEGGEGALLERDQLSDAARGQCAQGVELLAAERFLLRRGLELDEAAVVGHHHVHVRVSEEVLCVVKVQPRLAVDDADADRGDERADGVAGQDARLLHAPDGLV